jgi:hypothetical protein
MTRTPVLRRNTTTFRSNSPHKIEVPGIIAHAGASLRADYTRQLLRQCCNFVLHIKS